jgi:carbonic anhydrase/acetyltransferase-like protein (isoleucine patch superfamily)
MLKNVDIGRYCSFARGVQIGWDEHPADWVTSSMLGYVNDHHGWETALGSSRPIARHFNSQRGTTKIGHDVWIGLNSFIRNGVTIGNGAVIGAHAVVVKDVPPFSILAGHPTRLIRPRFDGQIAERLAAVEWWTYNLYEVPQHLLGLPTDFVSYMEDEIAAGRLTPYQPGWLGPVELGMAVASATI